MTSVQRQAGLKTYLPGLGAVGGLGPGPLSLGPTIGVGAGGGLGVGMPLRSGPRFAQPVANSAMRDTSVINRFRFIRRLLREPEISGPSLLAPGHRLMRSYTLPQDLRTVSVVSRRAPGWVVAPLSIHSIRCSTAAMPASAIGVRMEVNAVQCARTVSL